MYSNTHTTSFTEGSNCLQTSVILSAALWTHQFLVSWVNYMAKNLYHWYNTGTFLPGALTYVRWDKNSAQKLQGKEDIVTKIKMTSTANPLCLHTNINVLHSISNGNAWFGNCVYKRVQVAYNNSKHAVVHPGQVILITFRESSQDACNTIQHVTSHSAVLLTIIATSFFLFII